MNMTCCVSFRVRHQRLIDRKKTEDTFYENGPGIEGVRGTVGIHKEHTDKN